MIARPLIAGKDAWTAAGIRHSLWYAWIADGLMVRPIAIGARLARYPAHEVQAILDARISGATDAELRALVARLHAERLALKAA